MEENKKENIGKYICELSPETLCYNIFYHLENKHGITDKEVQETIKSIIHNYIKEE